MTNPHPSTTLTRRLLLVAGLLLAAGGVRATTVLPPDFPELVNEADCIVRAVVKSVESRAQATPNGQMIHTYVELQVTEVIAGHPPSPLILRVLGGKVGAQELIVQGAPRFHVGDEDILFVQGNGRQIFPLVRMMHGRYPVQRDAKTGREFIVRSNQVPLRATAEVGQPVTGGGAAELQRRMADTASALTPAQFTQQIRAAIKPDNLRLREH